MQPLAVCTCNTRTDAMDILRRLPLLFLLIATSGCHLVGAYLPVIILHGIFSANDSMSDLMSMVTTAHPGTQIHNIDGYDDLKSMENLWSQVNKFRKKMLPIFESSPDGVNMICFSQGALACRAILETTPQHNVKTFVSLSGPQGGQFGDTIYLNSPVLFPNFTKEHIYSFFYSPAGQLISIGNYWKDPHHVSEYTKRCEFLPELENPPNSSYRTNFEKLERLILIGGPDDGVITPWQSSQFGSYDKNEEVVTLENQEFYLNNSFGLKTLASLGKVHIHTVPAVQHHYWHKKQAVFKCCMEPYLN